MHNTRRHMLAAAAKDAIDGEINVTRWRQVWRRPSPGYWMPAGVKLVWDRPSSARAFLAKESEFYMEVVAQTYADATEWRCGYETDRKGSRTEYSFWTPHPRAYYEALVEASFERREIGGSTRRATPARAASCRL